MASLEASTERELRARNEAKSWQHTPQVVRDTPAAVSPLPSTPLLLPSHGLHGDGGHERRLVALDDLHARLDGRRVRARLRALACSEEGEGGGGEGCGGRLRLWQRGPALRTVEPVARGVAARDDRGRKG